MQFRKNRKTAKKRRNGAKRISDKMRKAKKKEGRETGTITVQATGSVNVFFLDTSLWFCRLHEKF